MNAFASEISRHSLVGRVGLAAEEYMVRNDSQLYERIDQGSRSTKEMLNGNDCDGRPIYPRAALS